MKIFVTGATGIIGRAVVRELLQQDHQVLGLARTEQSAQELRNIGVFPISGSLGTPDVLLAMAQQADAVIHLGYPRDPADFPHADSLDALAVSALAKGIGDSGKPLLLTSGNSMFNMPLTPHSATKQPQVPVHLPHKSIQLANRLIAQDQPVALIHLAPVVLSAASSSLLQKLRHIALQKGTAAYLGTGQNIWRSIQAADAAHLYVLVLNYLLQNSDSPQHHFLAATSDGGNLRAITTGIGQQVGVPTHALPEKQSDWFGSLHDLLLLDTPRIQRPPFKWQPTVPTVLTDLITAGRQQELAG